MGYNPPGSSVHVISQARMLEWIAFPPIEGLSFQPRDPTYVFRIDRHPLSLGQSKHTDTFINT